MKSGFRRFVVCGGVAGLLAASVVASTPTFTLTLAGIKKPGQDEVIFRNIFGTPNPQQCDPNNDVCPDVAGPGSQCVPTEVFFTGYFEYRCSPIFDTVPLLCEGGVTPGQPCEDDADCAPGTCTSSFVESGDQIMLEVFLSGWDDDPLEGICTDRVNTCIIGGPLCPGKHCNLSGTVCTDGDSCPSGEICQRDECLPGPLVGACQWMPDRDTFAGDSGNPAASLYLATILCTEDDDCRHRLNIAQCTCEDATCGPNGTCSLEAAAYIDLARSDLLCGPRPDGTLVIPDPLQYAIACYGGLEDDQKEYYVGTLWLQVPNEGTGTYILDMIHGPDFTVVLGDSDELFPPVSVNTLEVRIANPCDGFDFATECGDPTSVCHEWKCISLGGSPTCVEVERDCEEELGPRYECIVAEGGCVLVGACCVDPCTDECEDLTQAQCKDLDGFWLGDYDTCKHIWCDSSCVFGGPIGWTSGVPPSGVLDARQPHDVNDQSALLGIDTIVVTHDWWVAPECFEVCETGGESPPNRVESVVENPFGTLTITLLRPITPGAVTSITFCGGLYESTGTFASLPGDANADGMSNADDIAELVECCLNKSCVPAHGEYSCDIDHSGSSTAADVLRLLDLLSGAGAFLRAWDREQLTTGGCP